MPVTWLFPIIGFLSNWLIRGGGIEPFIGRNLSGGRYIHASLYGMCFALASGVPWHGPIAAGLMAIGQAPGWRQYISAMRGDSLNTHSVRWGIAMMTVRCTFWGVCLALCGMLVHSFTYAALCIATGLLGGLVYYLPIHLKLNYNTAFNSWTIAEQIYGFISWAPLLIL